VAAQHDDARPAARFNRLGHEGKGSVAGVRIGVDARAASEVPAGRGRLMRELLRGFAELDAPHEFRLYARKQWADAPSASTAGTASKDGPAFEWRIQGGPAPLWAIRAGRAAGRENDVVFATSSYLLTGFTRAPTVALVHDLVAFERELRAPRGSLFERLTLPLAVRDTHALICISDATRKELIARFPAADGKSYVISLGADERFASAEPGDVAARHGITKPYVLCTATLEPRKNVPRLIEAFAGLEPELRDRYELVLAGPEGWQTEETLKAIGEHPQLVRALGHVPDSDLPALYAGATVFAYPSLREGFGLPVLEAMAAGAPVLTSNQSSLPEVGGDAARYANPYDVESIRAGLTELLEDEPLRNELSAAGRERAARFTWLEAASKTLAILEAAAPVRA
jgi:alpha-1,3-rhamnosyl/mannosyltransferase